jgi:hypothetical protein
MERVDFIFIIFLLKLNAGGIKQSFDSVFSCLSFILRSRSLSIARPIVRIAFIAFFFCLRDFQLDA